MTPRKWAGPVGGFPPRKIAAVQPAPASEPSLLEIAYFVRKFIGSMVVFGIIGLFFSSRFPLALGAFLFLTDDEFIEWIFKKVGVQFVPDALGPEFIKVFVFMSGLWLLLASWKDAAPGWLLPWLPSDQSWIVIGCAALLCAILKIVSVMAVKKLMPQAGFEIGARWQGAAILAVLGVLLATVIAISMAAGGR